MIPTELLLMEALEAGRTAYADQVVTHAEQHLTPEEQANARADGRRLDATEVSQLRGPNVELIAQLLLSLRTPELADPKMLRCFLEERKAFNEALLSDQERRHRRGVTRQDLRNYTLDDDDLALILKNSDSFGKVVLNVSQLHKLISTSISYTTCTNVIDLLEKRKFVKRGVFVVSSGNLEDYYQKYLLYVIDVLGRVLVMQNKGTISARKRV